MTVRELREVVARWPDVAPNGEEAEVWVETGRGLSSQAASAVRLNAADLLIESNAFEEHREPEGDAQVYARRMLQKIRDREKVSTADPQRRTS